MRYRGCLLYHALLFQCAPLEVNCWLMWPDSAAVWDAVQCTYRNLATGYSCIRLTHSCRWHSDTSITAFVCTSGLLLTVRGFVCLWCKAVVSQRSSGCSWSAPPSDQPAEPSSVRSSAQSLTRAGPWPTWTTKTQMDNKETHGHRSKVRGMACVNPRDTAICCVVQLDIFQLQILGALGLLGNAGVCSKSVLQPVSHVWS